MRFFSISTPKSRFVATYGQIETKIDVMLMRRIALGTKELDLSLYHVVVTNMGM